MTLATQTTYPVLQLIFQRISASQEFLQEEFNSSREVIEEFAYDLFFRHFDGGDCQSVLTDIQNLARIRSIRNKSTLNYKITEIAGTIHQKTLQSSRDDRIASISKREREKFQEQFEALAKTYGELEENIEVGPKIAPILSKLSEATSVICTCSQYYIWYFDDFHFQPLKRILYENQCEQELYQQFQRMSSKIFPRHFSNMDNVRKLRSGIPLEDERSEGVTVTWISIEQSFDGLAERLAHIAFNAYNERRLLNGEEVESMQQLLLGHIEMFRQLREEQEQREAAVDQDIDEAFEEVKEKDPSATSEERRELVRVVTQNICRLKNYETGSLKKYIEDLTSLAGNVTLFSYIFMEYIKFIVAKAERKHQDLPLYSRLLKFHR